MATQNIDAAGTQAFTGTVLEILNHACLALMISIGHQTGLFDVLAGLPPSTSQQIADAAGLNERYVREWLGALVTGGIVEYAAAGATFRLPPERAAILTRAAGHRNLASWMQSIPLLSLTEPQIVEAFRHGGGVPYDEFLRFRQIMAQRSETRSDAVLVDVVLPIVPGLAEQLRSGLTVADVGCGFGHSVNLMARAFPRSQFIGYDFSAQGIAAGRAEAAAWGLTNTEFVLQDVAELDVRDRFDLITVFDAIHDQAKPERVLRNIAGALKPGGIYLMADVAASSNLEDNVALPLGTYMYSVSVLHCMTVSLAYGGAGLGTAWGEQTALRMLAEAGFTVKDVKRVPGDITNNYYICTTS